MRPVVALHGYGAGPRGFDGWRARLTALGRSEHYAVHYRTQSDDVGMHDLAEGFDRALALHPDLGSERPFDAIVHSTGMLVLRAWLAGRPSRRERLGAVVALAPAGFGSPLAHLGRGMLGAIFAGDRRLGPDFLEAGDRILAALELGSAEAWRLADVELPRTLVAYGTVGYPFPMSLAHPSGSDGVVRFAGCAAGAAPTIVDLRRHVDEAPRLSAAPLPRDALAPVPVAGRNHATILSAPPAWLVELAAEALAAHDRPRLARVRQRIARRRTADHRGRHSAPAPDRWRQWIAVVEDERGDPVPDYFLDLLVRPPGAHRWRPLREAYPTVHLDVHVHRDDRSRRCFHLDLAGSDLAEADWAVRILAESGSDRVGYAGHHDELDVESDGARHATGRSAQARWTGAIALGRLRPAVPTERLRLRIDREPLPLEGRNRLVDLAEPASA